MSLPPVPGAVATITSSTVGGESLKVFSDGGKNYSPNSAGSTDFPIGCLCPESKAAGGAVTCVKADKMCQGVQGLRIIIGDTALSVQAGFDMCNFNFHCNGQQPRLATSLNLNAPMV